MNRPSYRILLLEDSEWDAEAARLALAASTAGRFDVVRADTLAGAIEALRAKPVDAALLDLHVPDSSGAETIARMRDASHGAIPLVVLSGTAPALVNVASFAEQGASEVVVKEDLDRQDIGRILRFAIARHRELTDAGVLAKELTAMMDAIPDLVAVLDSGGRFVHWNAAYHDVLGYTDTDMRGLRVAEIMAPDEAETLTATLKKILTEGGKAEYEAHVRAKDGTLIPFQWHTSAVRNEKREITGLVGVGCDLRPVLAERERTQFFNMVAHEVNNPLSVLSLQVDMLKMDVEETGKPEHRAALHVIDESVTALRDLTRDLLDVARIQNGNFKMRPADVDLRALAGRVVASYQILAQKKDLTLTIEGDETPHVRADPRRLEQVIVNLLTNALKFTPRGGRIHVRVLTHDGHAEVHVRDTGEGIPRAMLARLFSPFVQAHDKDGERGAGLGLYISKGIASAHGGTIGCESAGPGQGSEFWISLPAA